MRAVTESRGRARRAGRKGDGLLETLKHVGTAELIKRTQALHRSLAECGLPGEHLAGGADLGASADSIHRTLRRVERDQALLDRKILRRATNGEKARVEKLRSRYLSPTRLQEIRAKPEHRWVRVADSADGRERFERAVIPGRDADSDIVRLIKLDSNARFYLARLRAVKARLEKLDGAHYSKAARVRDVIRDRTVRAGWWIKNNRALGTTSVVAAATLLKIAIAVFLVREVFGKKKDDASARSSALRGGPGDAIGQFPFENFITQPGTAAPIAVSPFGQVNLTV